MRTTAHLRPLLRPLLVGALGLSGCGADDGRDRVLLVTTTSVEASGLLDALTERYHAAQDRFRLSTTAVGSGAALEMARRGDADVLLTHHPEGEVRLAAEGHAVEQGLVMRNEFLVVGPEPDPAGVGSAGEAAAAFRLIAGARAPFISRGDDSGTHQRERALWREAGRAPWRARPSWYVEAGTGMAEALQMASELGAYTLTDRASFLFLRQRLRLRPLVRDPARLENPYTYTVPVAAPNPEGARDFGSWLMAEGQSVIAEHGAEAFGAALFDPAAAPPAAAPSPATE